MAMALRRGCSVEKTVVGALEVVVPARDVE